MQSDAARFWMAVDRCGPVVRVELGPCWTWSGRRYRDGYGEFRRSDGRRSVAHRAAWEIANGPIPDGLWVLHRCDNPPCVNPAHLFLGTQSDNEQDKNRKGRKEDQVGAQNPNARLSEEQVREIRLLVGRGETYCGAARRFGLCPRTVKDICDGKLWAHIPLDGPPPGRRRRGRPRRATVLAAEGVVR